MFDHTANPNGIKRWLRIATYDLCEEARERIDAEIEEHFAAAVEDAMEQGKSREAAESAALKALGNPYDAQSSFNRKYLTRSEITRIRALSFYPFEGGLRANRKAVIFILALALIGLIVHVIGRGWISALHAFIKALVDLSLYGLGLWMIYRLGFRLLGRSLRARLMLNGLALMASCLMSWLLDYWFDPTPERPDPFWIFFIIGYWILVARPIRKLGNDPASDPHIPENGPEGYA